MFTTYYNRACPVCRVEIDHYDRTCHAAGVPAHFVDIHEDPDGLAEFGLTADDVKRRLFCIDEEGSLHGGVDAAIVMWREMPSHRWLARVVRVPGIYRIAHWGYDNIVAPTLYAWAERRVRRREATGSGA